MKRKKSRPHSRKLRVAKPPRVWCASCQMEIKNGTWIQYTDGSLRHLVCASVHERIQERTCLTT